MGAPLDRKAQILLADLFYVNHLTKNRLCVPLNIGYISSYVDKLYGQDVEISMYKDVELLLKRIKDQQPDIVGFSFYYWNQNLNNYVVQQIRNLYGSDVLVVFGGPSVDSDEAEQLKLFNKFPEVDIFVEGEGEAGFAAIVNSALGSEGKLYESPIDCSLFIADGQLVKGEYTSINLDLSSIPSPYLNGSLDEFLVAEYMPLLQATRTCPYQCTFCVEGKERSRLRAFPLEQVKKEIDYICEWNRDRPHVVLNLAELNFGIQRQDPEIAEYLRKVADTVGYPRSVYFYQDKKFRESGKQVISALGHLNKDGLIFSLQTDHPEGVLAIKRKNLSNEMIQDGISWAKVNQVPVTTELIFGLPYETYDTMVGLLNRCVALGFDSIMVHNLFLMEGIELAREPEMERWGFHTDYRLLGNNYAMLDGTFVYEYERVVTASDYFNVDDFLNIRCLNLMFFSVFQGSFFKYFFHYVKSKDVLLASFFQEFMNPFEAEYWPEGYLQFVEEFRTAAVEELHPDLASLAAAAEQTYIANNGVAEPVRLNPYFYSRLMYRERDWIESVLLRVLENIAPHLDDAEIAEARNILELCGRLVVDLRDIKACGGEIVVEFDPNAWREDKFHQPKQSFATYEGSVSLSISDERVEMLKSFCEKETHLEDREFYFVAVETLFPRTVLFYDIDSSELESLMDENIEATVTSRPLAVPEEPSTIDALGSTPEPSETEVVLTHRVS
jgi:radical SAM superfamily enzyme YgiQ (UPF0313 family)